MPLFVSGVCRVMPLFVSTHGGMPDMWGSLVALCVCVCAMSV